MRALVAILLLLPLAAAQPSLPPMAVVPEQPHVTLAEEGGIHVQFAIVGAPAAEDLFVLYRIDGGSQEEAPAGHAGVMTTRADGPDAIGTHIYSAHIPAEPGQTVEYLYGSGVRGYQGPLTAKVPAMDAIRFASMGDIGYTDVAPDGTADPGTDPAAIKIRDLTIQNEPDLVIIPGDLAYQNSQQGWDRFMRMYTPLQATVPTMPVPGNHEWEDDRGYGPYLNHYVLPGDEENYAFIAGPVTFVGLNSDAICKGDRYRTSYGHAAEPCPTGEPDLELIAWIEQTLQAAQNDSTPWTVVYMHHPPYSHGRHGNDWGNQILWVPLFEKYGVDLVVTAHDHLYSRSYPILKHEPTQMGDTYQSGNGIVYVVTGGGGRPLYDITEDPAPAWHAAGESVHHVTIFDATADQITMKAIRGDGSELDAFSIEKASGTDEAPDEGIPLSLMPLLVLALLAMARRRA